ncbi:MAG: hypothetical protein RJB55_1816, partial [Verrucomicrobiota bacterium]
MLQVNINFARRLFRIRTCRCRRRLVRSRNFPAMSKAPEHTRRHSSVVVDGPSRAGARSMLRPVGFTDEDFKKPVVGIASLWSMVT